MLVGVLGCDLFRSMRAAPDASTGNRERDADEAAEGQRGFQFEGKAGDFSATMEVGTSGLFVVAAGSRARLEEAPSVPVGVKRLRDTMRTEGDLREEDGSLVFPGDYSFKSVSSARRRGVRCEREWSERVETSRRADVRGLGSGEGFY